MSSPATQPTGVLVFLHGGGFALGSSASHRKLAGHVTKGCGTRAFVADFLVVPIQLGAQWLQRALRWARDNDVDVFEATPESEDWWAGETERTGKATVMYAEGKKAKAWFLGENVPGKPEAFLVYMGGGQVYQQHCRELEESGYESMLAGRRVPQPLSS